MHKQISQFTFRDYILKIIIINALIIPALLYPRVYFPKILIFFVFRINFFFKWLWVIPFLMFSLCLHLFFPEGSFFSFWIQIISLLDQFICSFVDLSLFIVVIFFHKCPSFLLDLFLGRLMPSYELQFWFLFIFKGIIIQNTILNILVHNKCLRNQQYIVPFFLIWDRQIILN